MTPIATVQHDMTGLRAAATEGDRFTIKIVYGLVMRKQGPTLAVRAALFALVCTLGPLHHREKIPSKNNLSGCTSQSGREPKQGSMPRRHGSAEGAGGNSSFAIVIVFTTSIPDDGDRDMCETRTLTPD
jgi:hypothetical protein